MSDRNKLFMWNNAVLCHLLINEMIMVMGQKSSLCPVVAKKSYLPLLIGVWYSVA